MKKQILKTSVLAAVLLSMGMGMAHASGGATVNVMATIGNATCELDVKGDATGAKGTYQLDMGKFDSADVQTLQASAPLSAKNIEVQLVKCGSQYGDTVGKAFTPNAEIQMNVFGQTIDTEKKIFNANSDATAGVAVYHKGAPIVSGTSVQLTDTSKITLGGPLSEGKGMAAFKVALASKSSIPAAQEVIAPVTFQVVYK
ncbi:fimbrial protein [Photorhabdus laumondii]|uniref:fimbrial protein n=1 Tax=Photorhabdus laumondii TaxID=2218628 RepID=UPI003314A6D8